MSTAVVNVLLVDDDEEILSSLSLYLDRRGCFTRTARSGSEMDEVLKSGRFDVIVLDLMMPGEDGLSICRRLPADQPILMLSAIGDATDRILGIEMGAWDYLAKPFDPRELFARIRSLARRRQATAPPPHKGRTYGFEGWTVDLDEQRLTDPIGRAVSLSASEFDLLSVFIQRPGRLLSREQILGATHGPNADVFDRAIDVTVSRLRRKLGEVKGPIIETVRGEGYRFHPAVRQL
jgi:two-component system OmpR family response regulator